MKFFCSFDRYRSIKASRCENKEYKQESGETCQITAFK